MLGRTPARAVTLVVLVLAAHLAAASDDATLFRIFLKDGGVLVSYGELARVDDRVIFSIKTGPAPDAPLHVVNLDAALVDWVKTEEYAYAARATHYLATRAEDDYAVLANDVARTLSAVSSAKDPVERVKLVQEARNALANWPAAHFNYREAEVRQMLGMLDDAIASLKAAAGGSLDLSLVAFTGAPPVLQTVLPPPTLQESIEQVLTVARLSDMPADREALLSTALDRIDVEAGALPADFVSRTRAAARASLDDEQTIDRRYQEIVDDYAPRAHKAAQQADIHGLEWMLTRVRQRDDALGGRRPGVVSALVAEVSAELDAARRLQLARDRWTMRLPAYREYRERMKLPLELLSQLTVPLQEIKSLGGLSAPVLDGLQRYAGQIRLLAAGITPPPELSAAHALVLSAANLAENAARLRREAVLANSMPRAWDASSAAAGALMLGSQARTDVQAALRRPELP
jgi:hypothetical protein